MIINRIDPGRSMNGQNPGTSSRPLPPAAGLRRPPGSSARANSAFLFFWGDLFAVVGGMASQCCAQVT